MKKHFSNSRQAPGAGILILSWALLLLTAYGRLILNPDLHTACPENDTWNLPIRWSVLAALRDGHLPLWNSLSAFGMPWMATWQTETFYPGTLLFEWLGLSAWNYSGLFHLVLFSTGIYCFLRKSNVGAFGSFWCAAIALLNGCAYNHLGSNSSMDTMAWMPWLFLATRTRLNGEPYGGLQFTLLLALQVFAGYPQVILYTLVGCLAYGAFLKGWKALLGLAFPLGIGLFLSSAQWIPSVEYFFINCVRLPAVHDNPHFFLPLENLKTFFDFNALWKNGTPDYVLSPTFFYFNFSSGLIPLALLAFGLVRFEKVKPLSRFFFFGFFLLLLWSLGYPLTLLESAHIPFPDFLEPAKSWVLINLFELFALGLLIQDLFPKAGKWKWVVMAASLLNLMVPVWNHPLERNLIPPDPQLEVEAEKIKSQLGTGRGLILPDPKAHAALYTPLPNNEKEPFFKRLVPNSNLFVSLPVATFYGSTWPSWGALDAARYFQMGFPYSSGSLIDLLGIDFLYLPAGDMPSRFQKAQSEGAWTLWKNPSSMGSDFIFSGKPLLGTRKEAFEAFANGSAQPLQNLYLDPTPVSFAPNHFSDFSHSPSDRVLFTKGSRGFWIITQNAMPGWRAWVDGAPMDIYLADGIFLGVPIPRNSGWIKLAYEPASFRFGLFISLLSLGILIGLGTTKKLGWI